MTRLSVHLAYEAKTAELRGLVELEAKKLQDVIEERDSCLREVRTLADRKDSLMRQLGNLEKSIQEAEQALTQTIDQKTKFVDTAKVELQKEKKSLGNIQAVLTKTLEEIEEITIVSREIKEFMLKESDARLRWLSEKQRLNESKKEYEERMKTLKQQELSTKENKKELEDLKTYLTDFYGKIASYTKSAKETLEYINEHFEKTGTPLHFRIPEGEVLQIDIDNFNK